MAVQYEVLQTRVNKFSPGLQQQRTIKKAVSISGVGLFTAEEATLTISPAPPDSGIIFRRTDLEYTPEIAAVLGNVVSTPRCTTLGCNGVTIHTVEHILSAISAMGINNVLLDLSGPEIPIMDGSARIFVSAIREAEIQAQDNQYQVHRLQKPVSWSQGDVHLIAIPSDAFRISYTLHFPNSSILRSQYFSAALTSDFFAEEIAPCRTFCFYEEIAPFIESGLIKGGGLDNAVIIKNDVVINPDGTRFSDEMARHKILDLIGDVSLIEPFCAHIIAIRSGHASNIAFAQELQTHIKMEKA